MLLVLGMAQAARSTCLYTKKAPNCRVFLIFKSLCSSLLSLFVVNLPASFLTFVGSSDHIYEGLGSLCNVMAKHLTWQTVVSSRETALLTPWFQVFHRGELVYV